MFSHHPASTFFKLFVSSDIVVREAMKQWTLQSVKAAVKPTIWFILKLVSPTKQWPNYLRGRRRHVSSMVRLKEKAFVFFGELGIRELAKEWHYWVECG